MKLKTSILHREIRAGLAGEDAQPHTACGAEIFAARFGFFEVCEVLQGCNLHISH